VNSRLDADLFDGLDSMSFIRTPAQILAALLTVDGADSGVDADRLDGRDSSEFVRTAEQVLERLRAVDGEGSGVDADRLDGLDSSDFVRTAAQILALLRGVDGADSGLDADRLDGLDSTQFVRTAAQILERLRGVDGAGSLLDADRLDGLDSAQFLRSDRNGILVGNLDLRGLLLLHRREGEPFECDEENKGNLYYDSEEDDFVGCDGTNWVSLTRRAVAGGGGGGDNDPELGGNPDNPGANCADIVDRRDGAETGPYWIDPDGGAGLPPFKVVCDVGRRMARIFATYRNQAGVNEWALTWDDTINVGKRYRDPEIGQNYLLPLRFWLDLDQVVLTSQRNGSIALENFHISPANRYQISFTNTGNGRMDYHNNKPLSTVDRDNDQWGNHCANHARTFGWYQSCCNLCMTNGPNTWPGSGGRYVPTDWQYQTTDWMVWYGRFRTRADANNEQDEPALDCEAIAEDDARAADGVYWIDPDGDGGDAPFRALCDISGGGWTQVYSTHANQGSRDEWALSWDETINDGKRANDPQPGLNYLLPLRKWTEIETLELRSATSGTIRLEDFSIQSGNNYTIAFRPTANARMNYHNGLPLSTVDRDNDQWGNHCANHARTFGWYRSCCNLCMTTGPNTWPAAGFYKPTDWTYRATQTMSFWARFRRRVPVLNERNEAAADCRAILNADARARSGIYWVTLGSQDRFKARCNMELDGGGWTQVYATHRAQGNRNEWALSWDETINIGKRHNRLEEGEGLNYLLPLRYWNHFDTVLLQSERSGTIRWRNFSFDGANYVLRFDPTGNGRMDYHRGANLSTVDRDNDVWGNHCANHARTFGWYKSCCNLCMTTGPNTWPAAGFYIPTDWNYTATNEMTWWAR